MIKTTTPYGKKLNRMRMLNLRRPKYNIRRQDIRETHPRDMGKSTWDFARFDIDQFEEKTN